MFAGVGTSLVDADDLIRASFEETSLSDPSGNTNAITSKRFGSLYEDIANKSKAVPERLQGLGLGHLGWRPSSEETTTNTTTNTALAEIVNKQEVVADESNHVSKIDDNTLDVTPVSDSAFTPLRVSTVEWSVPSSSTVVDTTTIQNAKEQASENPFYYRQFRQADLITLRTKFRPEVCCYYYYFSTKLSCCTGTRMIFTLYSFTGGRAPSWNGTKPAEMERRTRS